jgi:hypothetical protein
VRFISNHSCQKSKMISEKAFEKEVPEPKTHLDTDRPCALCSEPLYTAIKEPMCCHMKFHYDCYNDHVRLHGTCPGCPARESSQRPKKVVLNEPVATVVQETKQQTTMNQKPSKQCCTEGCCSEDCCSRDCIHGSCFCFGFIMILVAVASFVILLIGAAEQTSFCPGNSTALYRSGYCVYDNMTLTKPVVCESCQQHGQLVMYISGPIFGISVFCFIASLCWCIPARGGYR